MREMRGLTLDRASSLAELDLAHWQKIEAGTVNVTLGTLLRIANALGSKVDALFGTALPEALAANPVTASESRARAKKRRSTA